MRRLRVRDWALLAFLGPLWLVCIGLHGAAVFGGDLAWVPVYVQPGSGLAAAPVVTGFMPGSDAASSGIQIGDELLRVGERPQAGAGRLDFVVAVHEQARDLTALLLVRRDGQSLQVALPLQPISQPWRTLPLVISLGALSLLVLARSPDAQGARVFALAGLAYSLHWSLFQGERAGLTQLSYSIALLTSGLFAPLTLSAILHLPGSSPPERLAVRMWPWGFALLAPATASYLFGWPLSGEQGLRLVFALYGTFVAAGLVLLARSYAHADALGRRSVKWVLYGFYVGVGPIVVAAVMAAVEPKLIWLYEIALVPTVLIPVCFYIAISRYRYFDIDRLISETTSYSIVLVVLLAGALTFVTNVAGTVATATEGDPLWTRAALSVLLAGGIVHGKRTLHPYIERLFFRERARLEGGLRALRSELEQVSDATSLFTLLGGRLVELLRPDVCVIYASAGSELLPAFTRGPVAVPAFGGEGALVTLLTERAGPVDVATWRRWTQGQLLSPSDAAGLENIGPDLLLPLLRGAKLSAFVGLGSKRSGDIYTLTEVAWLEAVAERASAQLQRFDDAEMLRDSRQLADTMRSYVPGPIAQELAMGGGFEPEQREVSMLFVDIREYTSFSETRLPEEIFSAVNQYTEAVSSLVRKHGGSVVDFHGDGLMVVFGAPHAMHEKERSAVEAALEVVKAVPQLPVRRDDGQPLSVGVGIATGPAFVGNIQAADRQIWTTIGSTTNLAARLQALTRDMNAAIAIDAATRATAGAPAAHFELHRQIRIRGRSEPQDVFALSG